jgi:hypothetical protein
MMRFLTCITGFFMNFELLPIMQIRKKGGWNLKKIFFSETTEPISTKLCWNFNCSYMARSSLTYIPGFSFSRYILIMQIGHILISDHI